MGRQSVTLTGDVGPRQRIWNAIRLQKGNEWTIDVIVFATGNGRDLMVCIDKGTARDYIRSLEKAGIIEVTRTEPARGRAVRKFYRLAADEGMDAPRLKKDGTRVTQGSSQQQMWRTLRIDSKGTYNARELAAAASTSLAVVDEVAAKKYLQVLHKAGYLDRVSVGHGTASGGKGGGIQSRYRLNPARNTGPKPPMICRTKVVYDPNERAVVWTPPVITEEDAVYD